MRQLSNRQWRALAQAYPFYLSNDTGAEGAAGDCALGRQAGLAQSQLAFPSLSLAEEFTQYVVPRVAMVFPEELQAYEKDCGCGEQEHPNGNELDPAASRFTAEAVDALLVYLFGCATSALSKWSPTKQRRSFASTCFATLIAPLSRSEQQLLGLYHRKQEQYAYVLRVQQQLLAASQLAVQTLQGVSGPILADAQRGGSTSRQGTGEGLTASARERSSFLAERDTSSWLPPAPAAATGCNTSACSVQAASSARTPAASSANGCDASLVFTSALAGVPYEIHSRETPAAAALPVATAGADSTSHQFRTYAAPPLIATNRCAGCHEVGGDLLVCTQCGEVRHEACGGPHPPEPNKVDGRMPTVNICKRCAKELNLSSGSSSLRSTTSSSERAELDEYFGSDDDEDSSLSGFIVNTSDDDRVEEDDQSADGDGSSDAISANSDEGERRRCGKERLKGVPPQPPGKGQAAAKDSRRRPVATATAVASEVPLGSSASSGSSSHVWSRSASLDRVLAAAAKRKQEKRGSHKRARTVSDDGAAGASAPRYEGFGERRRKQHRAGSDDEESGCSRHVRKRSGGDASDASSLVLGAPSTSSALSTKKVLPLNTEKTKTLSRHQTGTGVPPSPQKQQQVGRTPTLTGKESTTISPLDHRRAEAFSAQSRRAMVLEYEEELVTLGIALPSASGSPKVSLLSSSSKQRQGGIASRSAGRKGAMDIASSSASSDDRG